METALQAGTPSPMEAFKASLVRLVLLVELGPQAPRAAQGRRARAELKVQLDPQVLAELKVLQGSREQLVLQVRLVQLGSQEQLVQQEILALLEILAILV